MPIASHQGRIRRDDNSVTLDQPPSLSPGCGTLTFVQLPFSQPYPWAAAVLVDELYAGGFESAADCELIGGRRPVTRV